MSLDDRAIRRLRAPKPTVDPWRPHGTCDEGERRLDGSEQRCRTVFLSGAECPFTCVFCDLWRFTTDGATPLGALPRQLESALGDGLSGIDCLKLFNASNFFDSRAVPPEDLPAIARLVSRAPRVVVECHPRLIDRRCLDFAARLDGQLELALGLETANPDALARLNKKMSLTDFDRACNFAQRHSLDLRAFVLIGSPYVPRNELLFWIEETLRYAISRGVVHVALIPVRADNGALQALARSGEFHAPTTREIERSFASALQLAEARVVVTLDLWDMKQHLQDRPCCAPARLQRLHAMNLSGTVLPPLACEECEGRE